MTRSSTTTRRSPSAPLHQRSASSPPRSQSPSSWQVRRPGAAGFSESRGSTAAPVDRRSPPTAQSLGSVANSPGLPASFTKTFKDRFVQANGIRQHVVIGGEGPPLLLVHGWPENWYAWRT